MPYVRFSVDGCPVISVPVSYGRHVYALDPKDPGVAVNFAGSEGSSYPLPFESVYDDTHERL